MSGSSSIGSGYSANSAYGMNMSMANSSAGVLQASSSNSTYAVINQLKFLAAKSIRSSAIILAVFNTIAAFATAMGILYDCYQRAKRNSPRGQKVSLLTCVKGAETYPFFLSLAIVIQGIIFAVSQSRGLDGLFAKGCALISQFMLPAVFIVPFLQLIFGIELTLRGFRRIPFPSRGHWTVAICLAVWSTLLVITGLVTFFIPSADFCFASLFWFVAKWAEGGFALFTVISVVLVGCVITVFLKLTRHSTIETSTRVEASRMVYFLSVAIVSNVFLVPFFAYLTFSNPNDNDGNNGLTLSMIAQVVANVSGLMNGGLHLCFRANIISTIAPKDKLAEYERQQLKHKIRKADPGYDFSSIALQPVSSPKTLQRVDSEETLVKRYEKDEEALIESPSTKAYEYSPTPLRSNGVFPTISIPRAPEPAELPNATPSISFPKRRPSTSYSLFPNQNIANTQSITILPPTTYSPVENNNNSLFDDFNSLKPPPSIKSRHLRNSSLVSSATVQIGLRFSNVADMPPMAASNVKNAERVHNLDCPKAIRPTPMASFSPASEPVSPFEPSSPISQVSSRDPVKNARMKTLPPVPRQVTLMQETPLAPEDEEGSLTLSSAVYRPESPTKKVPSPKGVGFQFPPPKRVNTTPVQNSSRTAPPRSRGNSDAAQSRGDWI
ncbi:hypothetical protein BKA67DRAFT_226745 [Truncatella angustata]|uniref:Uncharacterized protein n=1 Tax=Truncatella angustata TaxID=152316 RepID=A0A9P8ZZK6_9PEZI|nr:uncharacterized protein BKA67DRAFT_226745 [Truncatella angustata]KAH6655119.1 hypothetical protein BKA67DRAFT_226745 [Truncatella angustata]KAH8196220.1 hypothetical protein TruAng_009609 [Truncatella angustata]